MNAVQQHHELLDRGDVDSPVSLVTRLFTAAM
jgi:hypothetical protein